MCLGYAPVPGRKIGNWPHEIPPICRRGGIGRSDPDRKTDSGTIRTCHMDGRRHMDNPRKGHPSADRTDGILQRRVDQIGVLTLPIFGRDISREIAKISEDPRPRQGLGAQPRRDCGSRARSRLPEPGDLSIVKELRIHEHSVTCSSAVAWSDMSTVSPIGRTSVSKIQQPGAVILLQVDLLHGNFYRSAHCTLTGLA